MSGVSSQSGSWRQRTLISGDEEDALTGWRKFLAWRPGERRQAKRSANRRERREAKRESRDDESKSDT